MNNQELKELIKQRIDIRNKTIRIRECNDCDKRDINKDLKNDIINIDKLIEKYDNLPGDEICCEDLEDLKKYIHNKIEYNEKTIDEKYENKIIADFTDENKKRYLELILSSNLCWYCQGRGIIGKSDYGGSYNTSCEHCHGSGQLSKEKIHFIYKCITTVMLKTNFHDSFQFLSPGILEDLFKWIYSKEKQNEILEILENQDYGSWIYE